MERRGGVIWYIAAQSLRWTEDEPNIFLAKGNHVGKSCRGECQRPNGFFLWLCQRGIHWCRLWQYAEVCLSASYYSWGSFSSASEGLTYYLLERCLQVLITAIWLYSLWTDVASSAFLWSYLRGTMEGVKCPLVLQLPHKNGLLSVEVKSLVPSVSRFSMYALEGWKNCKERNIIHLQLYKSRIPL